MPQVRNARLSPDIVIAPMYSAAILHLAALLLTLARISVLLTLELFNFTARIAHSLLSVPLLLLGQLPQIHISITWPAQHKEGSFTFQNGVFEGPTLEVDPAEPFETCEGDTVPAVLLLHSPGGSGKLQVLQRGLSGIGTHGCSLFTSSAVHKRCLSQALLFKSRSKYQVVSRSIDFSTA